MDNSARSAKLTQTERAYNALKKAILRGEIEEGAFLSESRSMSRYRIGRTPYREACNRLHHEKLLEAVPRRGYLVPEISYQSVGAIFETRLILEAASAELACARATSGIWTIWRAWRQNRRTLEKRKRISQD